MAISKTWTGISAVAALGLAGWLGLALNDNEEVIEAPEAEPAFSEAEKRDFFYAGASGMYEHINQAVSFGVMSDAQANQIEVATQAIMNDNKPESLLEELIEANNGQAFDYSSLVGFYGARRVPHEMTDAFTDYLSPQLSAFNEMVGGNDGCLTKFDQPQSAGDVSNSIQAPQISGLTDIYCENGSEVNILSYRADAEDVEVSYNFERAVAYFEKTGYYAQRNCDDENSCFSTESFKDLEGSEGLARAFADKARVEAYMTEIQTQAQAYFSEIWPQIQTEMAQSSAAPAVQTGPR